VPQVASSFVYASSAELKVILPNKYDVLTLNDPLFEIMPMNSVNAGKVMWDIPDDTHGLADSRRPGDPYPVVARKGYKRYEALPGYYGNKLIITEQMANEAAAPGTFAGTLDIQRLQADDQDQLLTRALQRVKQVGWTMLTTGKYTNLDANGTVTSSDSVSFSPFVTTIAWSNLSQSTPLYDLRQLKLRHRGQSVSFGSDARIYLNSTDVNNMLANTNLNDLGAKLKLWLNDPKNGSQPMTLADVNTYLMGAGLPQIVEWDDNYIDDSGVTQLYIPSGSGVCVGKRLRGEPVAEFVLTRNIEIMGGSAPSSRRMSALDNLFFDFEMLHKPWRGESTMGFNGNPAIYYPGAIVPFQVGGGGSDS